MFEVDCSDESGEFAIVVGAGSVDGPDIRGIFVPG